MPKNKVYHTCQIGKLDVQGFIYLNDPLDCYVDMYYEEKDVSPLIANLSMDKYIEIEEEFIKDFQERGPVNGFVSCS